MYKVTADERCVAMNVLGQFDSRQRLCCVYVYVSIACVTQTKNGDYTYIWHSLH